MDPAAVRFNRAIAPVASTVAWQSVGKWAWRTSTSIEWDEIAKGTVVTTVIDNYQESSVVNLVLAAAKCHAARFWIMFRSTRLIAQFAKSATEFNWQRDLLATYPPRRSTAAHAPKTISWISVKTTSLELLIAASDVVCNHWNSQQKPEVFQVEEPYKSIISNIDSGWAEMGCQLTEDERLTVVSDPLYKMVSSHVHIIEQRHERQLQFIVGNETG